VSGVAEVRVEGVRKRYSRSGRWVLDGIDATLAGGAVTLRRRRERIGQDDPAAFGRRRVDAVGRLLGDDHPSHLALPLAVLAAETALLSVALVALAIRLTRSRT